MSKQTFTVGQALQSFVVIGVGFVVLSPAFAQQGIVENAKDMRNLRNIAVAMKNYMAANDDVFPVFFQNINGGVCLPNAPTVCNARNVWQFHIAPYQTGWKHWTAPGETETGDPRTDAFNVSYAYNYGYLGTVCIANDMGASFRLGCPLRDPGAPNSSTFFKAVRYSEVLHPEVIVELADGGGKDFKVPFLMGSGMNPPDAWAGQKYFYGDAEMGWGNGCRNHFHFDPGDPLIKTGRWGDTDGFAPRYGDRANVVMTDGHVEPLRSVSQMATGTAWNPAIDCKTEQYVTDYADYHWDPRFDEGPQRRW